MVDQNFLYLRTAIPQLRPPAPQPTSSASSRTQEVPRFVTSHAASSPETPPPRMTTSGEKLMVSRGDTVPGRHGDEQTAPGRRWEDPTENESPPVYTCEVNNIMHSYT